MRPMLMSSVIVRNLPDQLVELVRDRILSGEVPSDRPIRQDSLAAELGVSKIPLREALTRLEQEGLLRSQANRGFFVRAMSAKEAEEVYALRLMLEPEMAAQAALMADAAQRRTAETRMETLAAATAARGVSVGALNRAFHVALIAPSNRPIATTILERLHVLSERYVRKTLESADRNDRASIEHREMLDAWLARDAAKVAALVRAHIDDTLTDLRLRLRT